jgi:hypothetical protein
MSHYEPRRICKMLILKTRNSCINSLSRLKLDHIQNKLLHIESAEIIDLFYVQLESHESGAGL